ncbi:MAG TPA: hypothetical protein QF549_02535 [Candidatus Saccharimonadaceae bacterium]|nr:hypothetical protein [Candidatus Saccharimonadaceae bacterium]
MNDIKKRRILVIALLAGVVLIITTIIFSFQNQPEPEAYIEDAATVSIDQDTGERLIDDPHLVDQTVEGETIILLGSEPLIESGIFNSQLIIVREELTKFVNTRLNGEYSSITLRPQELVTEDGVTSGTIRLGSGDIILPITITSLVTGETRVVIEDPENSFGGNFDSGEILVYGD